jgi:hypothetical protein
LENILKKSSFAEETFLWIKEYESCLNLNFKDMKNLIITIIVILIAGYILHETMPANREIKGSLARDVITYATQEMGISALVDGDNFTDRQAVDLTTSLGFKYKIEDYEIFKICYLKVPGKKQTAPAAIGVLGMTFTIFDAKN